MDNNGIMKTAKILSVFGFMRQFPDEPAALAFVEKHIGGDTPICPRCNGKSTSPRPKIKGHRCKKNFTVRVGTVFENSPLPLYINEFAFRLNDDNCRVDTIDRIAAVIGGSIGKRLTYKELTQ